MRGRSFPLWAALRGADPVDGSRIVGLLSHDTVRLWWGAKWHLCEELLYRLTRRRRVLCADAWPIINRIGHRYGSDFGRYFGHAHGVGFLQPKEDGRVEYNECQKSRQAATLRNEILGRHNIQKRVSGMSPELRVAYILLLEMKGVLNGKARFR